MSNWYRTRKRLDHVSEVGVRFMVPAKLGEFLKVGHI